MEANMNTTPCTHPASALVSNRPIGLDGNPQPVIIACMDCGKVIPAERRG